MTGDLRDFGEEVVRILAVCVRATIAIHCELWYVYIAALKCVRLKRLLRAFRTVWPE
jgi:hypothetical protein